MQEVKARMVMEPLTLPGTMDSLARIRAYIRKAAADAGLEQKRTYALSLAADEIATNIIAHGYEKAGLMGEIVVAAQITADTLAITLQDDATPYDPLQQAPPDDLDEPLEDRDIGGLGVFLAKQNVDDLLYEYRDGQNHTTFVMHINRNESNAHDNS